jgi:hypothetical protein
VHKGQQRNIKGLATKQFKREWMRKGGIKKRAKSKKAKKSPKQATNPYLLKK